MKKRESKLHWWPVVILGTLVFNASATELVHKFGSPSFSGINQSAHYLTIDEQERTRKETTVSYTHLTLPTILLV